MPPIVLIVEDDPGTLHLFELVVKREGYSAHCAINGDEAIAFLQQNVPDVVLLDLGLPGPGGAEILQFIQQTPALARTKTIVISAYTDLIREISHYDVAAVHIKPIKATRLLQSIKAALGDE